MQVALNKKETRVTDGQVGLSAYFVELVVCQPSVEGYSLLSLMRASLVVNRHLTVARC